MARRKKKNTFVKHSRAGSEQSSGKSCTRAHIKGGFFVVLSGIFIGVIVWYLTEPHVYFVGNVFPPPQPSVQSIEPGKFVVRGSVVKKFRNISFRQASLSVEIIPVAAAIFPESDSKRIERTERIPQAFDESRAIMDVSPSVVPPFVLADVRTESLLHLKLIAKRAVYIYKLKWIIEDQGEIHSTCVRIPLWESGMPPVSDKDSYTIECD